MFLDFLQKLISEVNAMPQKENDPQIKQSFETLPAFVQETVKQSGVQIQSAQQLEQCAQNLTKKCN